MSCYSCGADAVIVEECATCGPLGASAKCDECGQFDENPAHAGHEGA